MHGDEIATVDDFPMRQSPVPERNRFRFTSHENSVRPPRSAAVGPPSRGGPGFAGAEPSPLFAGVPTATSGAARLAAPTFGDFVAELAQPPPRAASSAALTK